MNRYFPRSSHRASPGFTLLEVIIGLAIMGLLAGALFNTVQATLSATAALSETQKTRQQVFGFFELCQQTFPLLPASSVVVWNNPQREGKTSPELTIRQAPEAFSWGESGSFFGEVALCTHSAENGSLTLGIEQRQIDPQTGLPRGNPSWLPLVYNLRNVQWKFYDVRTDKWQDFWSDTGQHPTLVKLILTFLANAQVRSQTYWLPPLSGPPSPSSSTPAVSTGPAGQVNPIQPTPGSGASNPL